MATKPQHEMLDIEEQLARITKMNAETGKLVQETKLSTPVAYFQGAGAFAALLGAITLILKATGN